MTAKRTNESAVRALGLTECARCSQGCFPLTPRNAETGRLEFEIRGAPLET